MKSSLLIVCLFALFVCCSNDIDVPKPSNPPDILFEHHEKNESYQLALDKYRLSTNSPGSILLVDRPGEQLWIGASGKANLEHNSSMQTNSQFRTGSITKMFTAVVILQLYDAGKISLDDKLVTHLPETNGNIPQADGITIRHLLAHLSGIIDPPNESLRYKSDIINDPVRMYNADIDETLKKYVYGKGLHFTPGSSYSYSNTNYWLLGKIAERITGESLAVAMKNMIFDPLQMTGTYLGKVDDRNVVRGYADLYANGTLLDVSLWDKAEGDGRADGGVVSTAEDLYKFMHALFNDEILNESTLADMKTVQLSTCNAPECEYGLGLELWRVESGIAYGHNGALIGIEANALYFESSKGISVLYRNKGDGSDKKWLETLMK